MKNIVTIVGIVLLVSIVGCSSKKAVDKGTTDGEEKTIGQQLNEAGKSLEDCNKNCEEAPTDQDRKQCLEACKYAKAMHQMAVEATKDVSDKTENEVANDFQKRIYGNMNEQQLAKIKALQAQGKIPQNLTAGAEGAKAGAEPNEDNLPEKPECAGVGCE